MSVSERQLFAIVVVPCSTLWLSWHGPSLFPNDKRLPQPEFQERRLAAQRRTGGQLLGPSNGICRAAAAVHLQTGWGCSRSVGRIGGFAARGDH